MVIEAEKALRYSRLEVLLRRLQCLQELLESILKKDNLASFEPRVANYLSENLRTTHG